MAGGDLRADAVAALGDDGIAEADDIHALFKHPAGKLLRDLRVIEHDGDDGVLAGQEIEAVRDSDEEWAVIPDGAEVRLRVKPRRINVFTADGKRSLVIREELL